MESKSTGQKQEQVLNTESSLIEFASLFQADAFNINSFLVQVLNINIPIEVTDTFGVFHLESILEGMLSKGIEQVKNELTNISTDPIRYLQEKSQIIPVVFAQLTTLEEKEKLLKKYAMVILEKINSITSNIEKMIAIRREQVDKPNTIIEINLTQDFKSRVIEFLYRIMRGELVIEHALHDDYENRLAAYQVIVADLNPTIAMIESQLTIFPKVFNDQLAEIKKVALLGTHSIVEKIDIALIELKQNLDLIESSGSSTNVAAINKVIIQTLSELKEHLLQLSLQQKSTANIIEQAHREFMEKINVLIMKPGFDKALAELLNPYTTITKDKNEILAVEKSVVYAINDYLEENKSKNQSKFFNTNSRQMAELGKILLDYTHILIKEITWPKNYNPKLVYREILDLLNNRAQIVVGLGNPKWIYSFISMIEAAVEHFTFANKYRDLSLEAAINPVLAVNKLKEAEEYANQYNLQYCSRQDFEDLIKGFQHLLYSANQHLHKNIKLELDVDEEKIFNLQ